ncbi:hypothetical protein ACHHYP_05366 [Achlya hypogyna]|uniref:EF-hand domain-containing protein n=1 Tax=Achlya hypogyna TaxID=1202772 RepID=A0A1V9YYL8_ACHHY|nr:hypothetical protein ACHHYP_05366 [Achlya hypogyna]
MDEVLSTAEELYLLNQRFDLRRIQRVWEMYRRYVNPQMTEGGYSLTQDELLFVIELPTDDNEVEARAFFERMAEATDTNGRDQMDMLEFLVAFTILCRGSLVDKCRFLFELFDFDVEDEIDQEELSLLLTVAAQGLHKLRLLPSVPTFDGITQMSVEGFVAHGVALGTKMNFNQFLDWATFHADPRGLMERFTCALRVHHLVHGMSRVAHRSVDPYYAYQLALQTPTSALDDVKVLCGPVIGEVTDRSIAVLYEFSAEATVTCYAFFPADDDTETPTDTATRRMHLAEKHVFTVQPQSPVIFRFEALAPERMYLIGITGIAPSIAATHVATVSTLPSEIHLCRLATFNHVGPPLLPADDVLSITTACERQPPHVTLHWHFGLLDPNLVQHALSLYSTDSVSAETRVRDCITSHCRSIWQQPGHDAFTRTRANLVLTPWREALYGGMSSANCLQKTSSVAHAKLEKLVQECWATYVTNLFHPAEVLDDFEVYSLGHVKLLKLTEATRTESLANYLQQSAFAACIVLAPTVLFPDQGPSSNPRTLSLLEPFNAWNLRTPARKLVIVAPTAAAGTVSTVTLKETSSWFKQLACGPLRQLRPLIEPTATEGDYEMGKFVVRHGQRHADTHVGLVTFTLDTTKEPVHASVEVQCIATAHRTAPPRVLVGPVVGTVTSREAQILLEIDQDAVVICQATDRITHDSVDLHTMQEPAPALHVTWVANDDLFANAAFQAVTSCWPDFLKCMTPIPATDVVVFLHRHAPTHDAILAAMAHWTQHRDDEAVERIFVSALRTQWMAAEEVRAALAHGGHWFLGTGHDWSRVNVPISRDVVCCARRVAFAYQRHGLWRGMDPLRRFGFHCQDRVGFLHIDMLAHRLDTDDVYIHNKSELLGPDQWRLVETVLSQDSGVNCLVVTCDVPFVWHGHRAEVPTALLSYDWALFPDERDKLITLAFIWKDAVPGRHLLFVCGGEQGAKTTLSRRATDIDQIVVGPVTCVPTNLPPPPVSSGTLCDGVISYVHTKQASPEYTSTVLTPHPLQARSQLHWHRWNQANAKVVLGPVLGKITATSARILIEVDRDVEVCTCVCRKPHTTDQRTTSGFLAAFTPFAFTVVELTPNTEYIVTFEGLATTAPSARFMTPHLTPNAFGALAVHDTNWQSVLKHSNLPLWRDILGGRSITAVEAAATAHANGDDLGTPDVNLWQRISTEYTSAPLRKPLVLVHSGGQVNMRDAFSDKELLTIIKRFLATDEAAWPTILQHRMQEVYRVQWNVPPFRDVLRSCSNLMLLHDTDLFFSFSVIESRLEDDVDGTKAAKITEIFREVAEKLWFLYQNQLAVDINPPETLLSTRTSTFVSFGQCSVVVLNQHLNPVTKNTATTKTASAGIDLSKVTQANNLLPPGAWLALDDALMYMKQSGKALYVFLAFDMLEYALNPLYLVGVNRLLEKTFEWKNQAVDERRLQFVTLGPSFATYSVMDQRSQGVGQIVQLASVSSPTTATTAAPYPPSGAISKRFVYEKQGSAPTEATRSFLMLEYLSDLSTVHCQVQPCLVPYSVPCNVTLGPVLGRIQVRQNLETDKVSVMVTILLEVNATCRITCVILDILSGDETRVSVDMEAHLPAVFVATDLATERRYAYHFEGLDKTNDRKGTFHTPAESLNALNVVALSSNFPQTRDTSAWNVWALLLQRLEVPWHGLDLFIHVGGQVPLQEAAHECMLWLQDECDGRPKESVDAVFATLRPQLLRRFQQEYRAAWNVPFVRQVLSHVSNLMVRSQADVANTYGRAPDMLIKDGFSARDIEMGSLVHEVAMEACQMYQGALGWITDDDDKADDVTPDDNSDAVATDPLPPKQPLYYAVRCQHIGLFVFDLRGTLAGDSISCNNRLPKPLPATARPTISEEQWLAFEGLLRKKSVRMLVLVMELPVLVTSIKTLPPTAVVTPFYNALDMQAHWLGCPSQLEQLLALLFKWKEKIDGRDVAVLSGNMGFALDTTIRDTTSSFLLHNYTTGTTGYVGSDGTPKNFVGPVLGAVRPFPFEDRNFFGPDKRFEFQHAFTPTLPTYVLLEIVVIEEVVDESTKLYYATSIGDVLHQRNADVLHAPTRLRRLPLWWRRYCLQDDRAFWSSLVVSTADERTALTTYLAEDKPYLNATKRWYAKHNLVDTTRLADLQSATDPDSIRHALVQVAKDMWAQFPAEVRKEVAVLSDTFVVDLALEQLRLNLSTPIDMERFRNICAALAKAACALKVAAGLAVEDASVAYTAARIAKFEKAQTEAEASARASAEAESDAAAMAALQKANLLEYATEMNKRERARQEAAAAAKEAAKAAKKAVREAEKRHHHADDAALHKEKKALQALKSRMETHYATLGQTPEYDAMETELARQLRQVTARQQRHDETKAREAKAKKPKETSS